MKPLALLLMLVAAAPAPAQHVRRSEQMRVWEQRREGRILPLRVIEGRVVPRMTAHGAQYLGFDFDGGSGIYTLKFLRDGAVIWVDVDGRTGQVLGRYGR